MKKLSISFRVTIFCTLIVAVIMILVTAFILATTDFQFISMSKNKLEQSVKDAFDYIDYNDGLLEIDDNLDLYDEGITLVLYGPSGTLLLGSTPADFPKSTPLISDTHQAVEASGKKWQIYDLFTNYSSDTGVWVRGIASISSGNSAIQSMMLICLISFPVFILIAALGGYLITKRAFLPVQKINESVSKISSGNDLSKRIAIGNSNDEIGILARNFDNMFERLEQSFENEKQFSSDVSHELRTPIAVIISQCEYALSLNSESNEAREAFESILEQGQRMSSLVSQLLELSRAERKENVLSLESVNLTELCNAVCEEMQSRAEDKKINLICEAKDEIEITADYTFILRMLINLISNAIDYGKENGFVRLSLSKSNNEAVISVEDNGIGIDEKDLGRIFDRFYRADPARKYKKGGSSGLGLSMVKWIAESHSGSVSVQSQKGEGTVFTVRLPFK